MTTVHRLVAYDRTTDRMVGGIDLPSSLLTTAKALAGVPASDPEALGSYPLSAGQVRDLAGILRVVVPEEVYDLNEFFLEPFEMQDAVPQRHKIPA